MPSQNVETSTTVVPSFSTTMVVPYNLCRLANFNPAYGAAIQVVYTFGTATSAVISLQVSNDGVNYTPLASDTTSPTASGNVLWDLGHPNYKWIQVSFVPTGGTISASIIFNANNF